MILILIGRSGSGKSVVAQILKDKYGYEEAKSATTRAPRDDEAPDAYQFMSHEEFEAHVHNGDFAEYDIYGNNMYGMLKSSLATDKKLIAVMTPQGAASIKAQFPDAFVVHVLASPKTSTVRAIMREQDLDPKKMRAIANRMYSDYYLYDGPNCDFTAKNDKDTDLGNLAEIIVTVHQHFIKQKAGM